MHKSLCAVTSLFNPAQYETRYEAYDRLDKHIKSFGIQLITVELVFNDQNFRITKPNNPYHIRLRTNDILWYKENILNIGINNVPDECEDIAWLDLEVEFLNPNWVEDTTNALKKYKVVQLFDVVQISGPNSELIEAHAGYGWCYATNSTYKLNDTYDELKQKYIEISDYFRSLKRGPYCTTGYAWAARKSALKAIGGLFDKGILGDGDKLNAKSFTGELFQTNTSFKYEGEHFVNELKSFSNHAFKKINGSVGYVSGLLNHLYHGSRKDRNYLTRRDILNSFPYEPKKHLYYDKKGLLHFVDKYRDIYIKPIMGYFMSRNEDNKDVEEPYPERKKREEALKKAEKERKKLEKMKLKKKNKKKKNVEILEEE
jgi:hypothetical protein